LSFNQRFTSIRHLVLYINLQKIGVVVFGIALNLVWLVENFAVLKELQDNLRDWFEIINWKTI
jgi:hypothetical protein